MQNICSAPDELQVSPKKDKIPSFGALQALALRYTILLKIQEKAGAPTVVDPRVPSDSLAGDARLTEGSIDQFLASISASTTKEKTYSVPPAGVQNPRALQRDKDVPEEQGELSKLNSWTRSQPMPWHVLKEAAVRPIDIYASCPYSKKPMYWFTASCVAWTKRRMYSVPCLHCEDQIVFGHEEEEGEILETLIALGWRQNKAAAPALKYFLCPKCEPRSDFVK